MSERLRYTELAPEGMAPMRGLEHYLNATTALAAVLLEFVRLRASLLNGCSFCTGHHTRELQKHNEPLTRIEAVRDWAASDAFTPKERAALAWTDAVTEIQATHASDAAYAAVSVFFEGKDLVDLTLAISSINAWNRMSIAFGAQWDPSRGKTKEQQATGGRQAASQEAPDHRGAAAGRQETPESATLSSSANGARGWGEAQGGVKTPQPSEPSDSSSSSAPSKSLESPQENTSAHEEPPQQDALDDDGGKVAQD